MKIKNRIQKAQSCLWTVALASIVATLPVRAASTSEGESYHTDLSSAVSSASPDVVTPAASTPLNGRILPRPVTPGDVTLYSLPANTEYSPGLYTFAIGTPVYLEADVNIALAASAITNVTWSITAKPIGSQAAFGVNFLPTNMPVFLPSDRFLYQVAGRTLLRPDLAGEYTVSATIYSTTSGSTNVSINLNVGTYMGVETCAFCHSGNSIGTPDIYPSWSTTEHASMFTQGIDGVLGAGYSVSCIKCHTTGYDTNASALADGGFYSVQQQVGWTFPTVLTNTNWAAVPNGFPSLQAVANITCENCHGPGSLHAEAFGDTNAPGWPRLDVSYNVGDCNQCHDDPPHHQYGTEWLVSDHAGSMSTAATIPSGSGHDACVQCHTAYGFITAVSNALSTNTVFAATNTTYAPIGCQTCHEPHGLTSPTNSSHLIRTMASATFGDGTVITNGGEANLCMTCHHSRNGSAVTNVMNYAKGLSTWYGNSSTFGPHDGPQGDMLEGVNAITYGLTIPSSAHRLTVTNACVGCHMQAIAASDPGVLLSGGHTFEMSYLLVTNGVTNKIDQVGVCNQCHGGITNFNFPVEDYAGVGVILGVQTNVQILLDELSTLLPNSSGVVDGTVKSSLSVKTNWTTAQLNAAYNWEFVSSDGSLGVHNAPFATGLLKASIANLTGISVPGGLPDAWEIANFGSITNALGAPDADPAGDGIPNWLKYSLGLNPKTKGIVVPNGVVYANGNALGGNTPTNTLKIYTAADVSFNTVSGTTYQIQEVSSLSGGWANVGGPIVATNNASFSYLTPTVGNVQRSFRVVSTP